MMTPEEMAHLHSRAFDGQGRAWSAEEFADLLQSPFVFVVGDNRAFALGRVIADEAELLTLATDPDLRRQGHGRTALRAFEERAAERGAWALFLEVAADNGAAIALYKSAGFHRIATRTAYYRKTGGSHVDALMFRKETG